ncbi:MAG: AMP-binding protein [Smithellaceae bacterium]
MLWEPQIIEGGNWTINLFTLLDESSKLHAGRPALISEQSRITYRDLYRSVIAIEQSLRSLGLKKGDKVAVMLPNIPEFVFSYFAVVRAGAVAVTLSTASTPRELLYILDNSEATIFVTQASAEKKYREIEQRLKTCHSLFVVDAPDHQLAFDAQETPVVAVDPDDPAVMIYTAGLTGTPLGALLTHRNLLSQANMIQDVLRRTPDDVGLSLIPLFHAFGATVNMLNVIRAGCSTVMMDRLTMDGLFSAIERERITYIAAVPRLYLGMIFHEKASKYDLSSLTVCATGGAPMPPEFIPVFEEKFRVRILEGYGLTEASPACSFNRLDRQSKPGSIGIPLPSVDIKIVDDHNHEVAKGSIGEVIVRGENVMKGYYRDDEATHAVIRDGWLHTGDLGYMDEGNYIFLAGRKKRMIITSGFNVYPREVEAILNLHPAVKNSVVSGREDLMRGELVKARIVLKDNSQTDEKDIIRHCKIHLSAYKVPREIEFVPEIDQSLASAPGHQNVIG